MNFKDKDPIIIVSSAQSNEGREVGGDTPVDDNVRAWNATADAVGTDFVTGEIGQAPCRVEGYNNQFLQCCRELAERTGKRVLWLNISKGGLSIDNWLPNAPIIDMYNRIATEVPAMLEAAQLPTDTKIDAFIFAQGEQDDNSQSYIGKERQLRDRLKANTWWGDDTKFVTQFLAEGDFSGMVNLERIEEVKGNDSNYAVVNTFDLTTYDDMHWDAESLTEIGKRTADAILALNGDGRLWLPEYPLIRTYEPEIIGVDCTHLIKQGNIYIDKHFVEIEFFISYESLDTTDASAIQIELPSKFPVKNLEHIEGELYPYLSTGLMLSANDSVYFQNQGSDVKARFVDANGNGISYNSGKINASGDIAGKLRYRWK